MVMCLMGCLSFSVCFNTLASKSFQLDAKRSSEQASEREKDEQKNNFFHFAQDYDPKEDNFSK